VRTAPLGERIEIMDVGFTCAYLATPYARRLSGETVYIDGGVNVMAWRVRAPHGTLF
jgi:enoyl-[acyl-carrier protein] reductase I